MSETCTGIFDTQDGRSGFVRPVSTEMKPGKEDAFVPPPVTVSNRLRNGALVTGRCVRTHRGLQLASAKSVNGVPIAEVGTVKEFDSLTPVHPDRRIVLEPGAGNPSMRVVDLIAPVGKGQRALIAAPPRSGKTRLLTEIAEAISTSNPETKLVVLLLDERPEEVTQMVRSVKGLVFASSNDQDTRNHIRLARLALDYAKRWAEVGSDVVMLVDSLTRLGRASNIAQTGPGRTMSGGMDSRALELPRRVFGTARELEEGGSITIVATALTETNSRMDDIIFQDFKGTGNCEIVLSRELAELRIFPAIDIKLSGTRNEEILLGDQVSKYNKLRRLLYDLSPADAMKTLLKMICSTGSNTELLDSLQ